MKRIFMLLALALMVVAAMALSGVAQAASPSAKCQQAAQSLGISGSYNFVGGNNKRADDFSSKATEGVAEVFCGFGGNDSIGTLGEGDIFIGGAGDDYVTTNYGTFYGEAGTDSVRGSDEYVYWSNNGTFYGGEGDDYVSLSNTGTVYGEAGDDHVSENDGTFYGGAGNDSVFDNYATGTFYGEEGDDWIYYINYGTFYQ